MGRIFIPRRKQNPKYIGRGPHITSLYAKGVPLEEIAKQFNMVPRRVQEVIDGQRAITFGYRPKACIRAYWNPINHDRRFEFELLQNYPSVYDGIIQRGSEQ